MNNLIRLLKALLELGAQWLPEGLRGTVKLVTGLLGGLTIGESDPRASRVAQLVAELVEDMTRALSLPDAGAVEAARLALEHKFLRAWVELFPGGSD